MSRLRCSCICNCNQWQSVPFFFFKFNKITLTQIMILLISPSLFHLAKDEPSLQIGWIDGICLQLTMYSQNSSRLAIGYSTTGRTVFSYRFAVVPG